jgi:hypothetical protein
LPSHLPWKHHVFSNNTCHLLCRPQHRGNSYLHVSSLLKLKDDHKSLRIAQPQIPVHMQILALHTIRLTPISRSILLEHYIDAFPKHTWEVHIIAIWNTEGRNCINACDKNWLKDLAKEILEAKWEINCIHNYPCPSALSTEETPGLNKVRKLQASSRTSWLKAFFVNLVNLVNLVRNYPTTSFVKPHKASKIKKKKYLGPTPVLWRSDPTQLQPKPDPYSTRLAGLMAVLKTTKKGKTQDQVCTTLAQTYPIMWTQEA